MATAQSTADFLVDQMSAAGDIRSRKMFGEYAIYCNDTVVALVCDDRLFVKPTEAGRAFIGDVTEGAPYPGAKLHFQIDEEKWEDAEWMATLIEKTAAEVPHVKKRKK